jgi:hypothetical protein
MKKCTKCNELFSFDFFYKNNNLGDGFHPWCKDCKKKCDKERYEKKKDEICKQQQARYAKNVIRERESAKSRYKRSISTPEGKRRVLDKRNEWSKSKSKSDPAYRINRSFSREINRQVNKNGRSYLSHVGYSIQELMQHLEKQFNKKMSWSNYGSYWHIDHIMPKVSFKIAEVGDDEFKACWCLSNLRPLEAVANLSKGAKVESIL